MCLRCDRISATICHNEHIQSQGAAQQLSLDFTNIVASCQSKKHFGHYKGDGVITLTPLMTECESEIRYNLNGNITHTTPRAQNFISVLGLRTKGLGYKRKKLVELLIFDQIGGEELIVLDNELLELLIADLLAPSQDQKLEAFSPILARILSRFIS